MVVPEPDETQLRSRAAEIEKLQRRLRGTVRRRGCDGPDALAIYVHALSTEVVIVQVLLRDRPPLMPRYVPDHNGANSWLADPDTVRRYATATRTATRTFLKHLQHDDPTSSSAVGLPPRDRHQIVFVLQHLLLPSLARAAADIESVSSQCQQRAGQL